MSWHKNWFGEKNEKRAGTRKEDLCRSKRKTCVCGGHNANNPKKNLNHHSTKSKYNVKLSRKFVRSVENGTSSGD